MPEDNSYQPGDEHPVPERDVDDFTVEVEEQDGAWAVVKTADGQRSVIETHPDKVSADRQAAILTGAALRHDNAAPEREVPDSYPGKGVDET